MSLCMTYNFFLFPEDYLPQIFQEQIQLKVNASIASPTGQALLTWQMSDLL